MMPHTTAYSVHTGYKAETQIHTTTKSEVKWSEVKWSEGFNKLSAVSIFKTSFDLVNINTQKTNSFKIQN